MEVELLVNAFNKKAVVFKFIDNKVIKITFGATWHDPYNDVHKIQLGQLRKKGIIPKGSAIK